jgi:hypothetical protein
MKRNAFDREMCHDYFQYVEIPYVTYLKNCLALRLEYLVFDPLLTSLCYITMIIICLSFLTD